MLKIAYASTRKFTMTDNKVIKFTQQIFVGLQDDLKTSSRHVLKTSSIRLQRNNFTSSKTSSRRLGIQKIVTLRTS